MKNPFTRSPPQGWQPAVNNLVRFRATEPPPQKLIVTDTDPTAQEHPPDDLPPLPLPDWLEPFRHSVGTITSVGKQGVNKGFVTVAFEPLNVENALLSEEQTRYFHIPIGILEQATVLDETTIAIYEAVEAKVDSEDSDDESTSNLAPRTDS